MADNMHNFRLDIAKANSYDVFGNLKEYLFQREKRPIP